MSPILRAYGFVPVFQLAYNTNEGTCLGQHETLDDVIKVARARIELNQSLRYTKMGFTLVSNGKVTHNGIFTGSENTHVIALACDGRDFDTAVPRVVFDADLEAWYDEHFSTDGVDFKEFYLDVLCSGMAVSSLVQFIDSPMPSANMPAVAAMQLRVQPGIDVTAAMIAREMEDPDNPRVPRRLYC
jgi:hypothetical protein